MPPNAGLSALQGKKRSSRPNRGQNGAHITGKEAFSEGRQVAARGRKAPPPCECCFPGAASCRPRTNGVFQGRQVAALVRPVFSGGGKLPPPCASCRTCPANCRRRAQAAVRVRQAAVAVRKLLVASGRLPALSGRLTPARNRSSVADVMHLASALAALPYRRDLRETKNVSP